MCSTPLFQRVLNGMPNDLHAGKPDNLSAVPARKCAALAMLGWLACRETGELHNIAGGTRAHGRRACHARTQFCAAFGAVWLAVLGHSRSKAGIRPHAFFVVRKRRARRESTDLAPQGGSLRTEQG